MNECTCEVINEHGITHYMLDDPECLEHGDRRCPWCFAPVARPGDTCDFLCYEQFFISLGLVGPYIKGDDTAPNDLYDQPWYDHEMTKE